MPPFLVSKYSVFPQALSEVESGDLVQTERARKAAARKSKMDADLDAESADLMEKKGVSTCIHQTCHVVNLVFSFLTLYLIYTLYLRTPFICRSLLYSWHALCTFMCTALAAWCTEGVRLGGPCLHGG